MRIPYYCIAYYYSYIFVFHASFLPICSEALAVRSDATPHRISIVTGANGFLGKSIVHEILDQSDDDDEQRVFCLVRSTRVAEEEQYWQGGMYSTSSCKVTVLPYDMLDGGATMQQALALTKGDEPCCIYHVASNFGPSENHKQQALENVKGTEDLIQTIAAHPPRHYKLVLTSSMAAVRGRGQTPRNGKRYTTEDWNTLSELGVNWGSSYQWSKAQSERRARELANELGISIATLCPSFIFGPPRGGNLNSTSSFSVDLVEQWVRGESQVQSRLFVDVRDAAAAHVAAGRSRLDSGKRYIVSTEARVSSETIATWLKDVCTETGLSDPSKIHFDSEFSGGAIPVGQKEVEAEQRLEHELGIKLRPVKDTIVGMARTLLSQPRS